MTHYWHDDRTDMEYEWEDHIPEVDVTPNPIVANSCSALMGSRCGPGANDQPPGFT